MTSSLKHAVPAIASALVLLGLLGALVYEARTPHPAQKFTEFYILDTQGKAQNYPTILRLGETGKVLLVIVNREAETLDYAVEVSFDGIVLQRSEGISLPGEGKWQKEISFTPAARGEHVVEFFLYRSGVSKPYRGPLSLRVTVN